MSAKFSTPMKNKRIPVGKSRVAGFLSWGSDNLFPQKWLEVLGASPVASRCIRVRAAFIEGNGITDANLAKMVVHRSGMRLDELIKRTSDTISTFEVIPWHITYNGLAQIVGVRPVQGQIIRLKEPDDYGNITRAGIFPYLGSTLYKDKREKHTELSLFNPNPEVVLSQIEASGGIEHYPGQLLYEPLWLEGDEYYHTPSYFSAEKDIQSDAELCEYDFNSIQNGFNASAVLAIVDSDTQEENYDPLSDPNSIESQLANGQGAENASVIIVHRAKTKEQVDALRVLPLSDPKIADRYTSTSERVPFRITTAMGVPSELANVRRTGGALFQSALEQKMAFQMMQAEVNLYQRKLSDQLARVFQYWKTPIVSDFKIENKNYFPDDAATPAIATQAG